MSGPTTARRISPRVSPGGTHATCVALDTTGAAHLETWRLATDGPRRTFRRPVGPAATTVGHPHDDGTVLMIEHNRSLRTVTPIDADGTAGPAHDLQCDGVLAGRIALTRHAHGTRLRLVGADGPADQVWDVPGEVVSGWVTHAGLLLTTTSPGAVVLTPGGAVEPFGDDPSPVLAAAGEHALLARDGRLVVRSLTGHETVLARPAGHGRGRPVAVHPDLALAAVHVENGARSGLVLLDADGTRAVGPDPAWVLPAAAFGPGGVWAIAATPDRPPAWVLADRSHPEPATSTHLETFRTADGPIEAVILGDWRTAPRVVIALHGGPRDQWRFDHEPTLRALAGPDVAVVALNQRGSTGYGTAHELAIHGRWGGPDLADVLAVADRVRDGRGPAAASPALYGVSYGAFLALLAGAARPVGWSACIAVAPFRSAASLHDVAGAGVRTLLDRLAARREITDDLGPRDLGRLAGRITCPVLLAHGRHDEVIPVSQAREIAAAITAPLTYLELPDHGHSVHTDGRGDAVQAAIAHLLAPSSTTYPEGGDHHVGSTRAALAAAG